MRITVELDDTLLARAQVLSGPTARSAVLRALIERESARGLIRLGGCEPGLKIFSGV